MKTTLVSRPMVKWDAKNITHRLHYRVYCKTNTWATCPTRYTWDSDHNNLISHINQQLLDHYMSKEFDSAV